MTAQGWDEDWGGGGGGEEGGRRKEEEKEEGKRKEEGGGLRRKKGWEVRLAEAEFGKLVEWEASARHAENNIRRTKVTEKRKERENKEEKMRDRDTMDEEVGRI